MEDVKQSFPKTRTLHDRAHWNQMVKYFEAMHPVSAKACIAIGANDSETA